VLSWRDGTTRRQRWQETIEREKELAPFSAGRANENGYMGDVSRVHADILRTADSKKK
jgi:hypothetical protein